jgi:lipooligosaccharide transport system permease protein
MFLSGVFFPSEQLPDIVRHIAEWLPLTQAIALVRPLFLDQWPTQPALHLGVLALYATVSWKIALHLTKKRFKA